MAADSMSPVELLREQMSEFELLKAMYPNSGEIVVTDKELLNDINNFINGETQYMPNHLDFKLNLNVDKFKLEVFIYLPGSYPIEEPDIYVRCNQLGRQQETSLNTELTKYIKENSIGEVCLYTAISWLQENINKFTNISQPTKNKEEIEKVPYEEDKGVRLWVYSHHIYNKRKRDEIVKMAKDLKLTGFCLPGKPGIICIEGSKNDCDEWWRDIKSMSWKKIMIRKTEVFESIEQTDYKKFLNFEELAFKSSGINKHANMSELSKYMSKLGLSQAFQELFGLNCDE